MDWKCPQQTGNGMREPGMAGDRADVSGPAAVEKLRRQSDQGRGSTRGVSLELGKPRHRLVVKVETSRFDQRLELRRG